MPKLYIGLISGTSVDAVDAALLDFEDRTSPILLATHGLPPPPDLRERLLSAAMDSENVSLREFGQLDQLVANWFAEATRALLADLSPETRNQIKAIGSHGQTLYHGADANPAFTLQIGDPARIAVRTGLPTVGFFRQADMAAGGQGAPLATAFHAEFFRHPTEHRCALNLGGIANLTDLPPSGSDLPITGFDTGPSNGLLDAWIKKHLGHQQDDGGQWGRQGAVDNALLERLLDEGYFRQPAPKSTGREFFNLKWLENKAGALLDQIPIENVMRTLYELTAISVADSVERDMPSCQRVLLCGGGAHNPLLVERLEARLAPRVIAHTGDYGVSGDWIEAATFAWLAMRRLEQLPGNLPSVTGAGKLAVLGGIFDPAPGQ